jgi:hypothetical protein
MGYARTRRLAGLALAVCVLVCLTAAASATASVSLPATAAEMYEPGRIVAIELTLLPESRKKLEEEPETDEYQPGTFSLAATDGTPAGTGAFTAPINVEIRLKGGKGSFKDLSGKAGFKIKFAKANPFLGLRKMTLNSMVQDPSMVREARAYEAFRALGIKAPNTGYAFVKLDGEVYGTYLNIESLDKVALEKRFGKFLDPPQHLYEGEYGADVGTASPTTPQEAEKAALGFEVDEGDDKERGDLEMLITAVNAGASGWLGRVGEHADLAEMTRMWAVERYIGHWDSYSGYYPSPEPDPEAEKLLPNNYYLYSDPSGRFQMLPWGTDRTWDERLDFDAPGGVLFDDCLADVGCAAIYRAAAEEVLKTLPSLGLSTKARCAAEALRPFQQAEAEAATATRVPPSATLIADRVHADRVFMESRAAELADWLGVPGPAPDHSEPPCVEPERTPPPPGIPSRHEVHLNRVAVAARVLVAHLSTDSSGSVDLRATLRTRRGRVSACRRDDRRVAPGFSTLRCRLTPAARKFLSLRWRKMRVAVVFTAPDGASDLDRTRVVVPRIGAPHRR